MEYISETSPNISSRNEPVNDYRFEPVIYKENDLNINNFNNNNYSSPVLNIRIEKDRPKNNTIQRYF